VPFSLRVYLPGYAGELAHELGLIATDLPFDDARRRHRIDEVARSLPVDADFSRRIREVER
jgi:hypothetical protein